jgi:hypothetical protein
MLKLSQQAVFPEPPQIGSSLPFRLNLLRKDAIPKNITATLFMHYLLLSVVLLTE